MNSRGDDTEDFFEFLALKKKKDPLVHSLKFHEFLDAKEEGLIEKFDYIKDEYLNAVYLQ